MMTCELCNGTGEYIFSYSEKGGPLMDFCHCQAGVDKAQAEVDAVDPDDCQPMTKAEIDRIVNWVTRAN